jgi:hypothetical protein
MTWIVAKKTPNAVFVMADSAVTIMPGVAVTDIAKPATERSSFGEMHVEQHISGRVRRVYESVFKLYKLGDVVAAFAGDVQTGLDIIEFLAAEISNGGSPEKALNDYSIRPNAVLNHHATILVGWISEGPRLYRFDTITKKGTEIEDLVCVGSAPEEYSDLVGRLLSSLPAPCHNESRWMPQALALLQSFGQQQNMMQYGIGGVFAGAWIDRAGFHWQSDTYYVIHDNSCKQLGMAAVFVRNECLVTISHDMIRAFINPRETESPELTRQRAARAYVSSIDQFDSGRFEYIVFLNCEKHVITVVEMNCHLQHECVIVEPKPGEPGTVGLHWSPTLQGLVTTLLQIDGAPPRDLCLYWIPFREHDRGS